LTPSRAANGLLAKADEELSLAQRLISLSAGQGARLGYMAAFHAAQAVLLDLTGSMPKTHSGTRNRFSELAKSDARLGAHFGRFFALAYEQKDITDYRADASVEPEAAAKTIATAADLVAKIKIILNAD